MSHEKTDNSEKLRGPCIIPYNEGSNFTFVKRKSHNCSANFTKGLVLNTQQFSLSR